MRSRDERAVKRLMAEARKLGCAFSPVEHSEGSLSVPVFLKGQVRAALLMMYFRKALSRRTLLQEFYPQLRRLADEISRRAEVELAGLAPARHG